MKQVKLGIWTLAAALLLQLSSVNAQELPQPSQMQVLKQRVGLTDVTAIYSRPGVKDRKIWGELVPYGDMWRTGANGATHIVFGDDVKLNGNEMGAGDYAFFIIPKEEGKWTIVVNGNPETWGTNGYDKTLDIVRFEVEPEDLNHHVEWMTVDFTDLTANSATISLSWEKKRVSFKMEVNTDEKAMANIRAALKGATGDDAWKIYRDAASYTAESNDHLGEGLSWIETSIQMKDTWYSHWVKADILAAQGQADQAIDSAKKAIKMGQAAAKKDGKEFNYETRIMKDIEEWKAAAKG